MLLKALHGRYFLQSGSLMSSLFLWALIFSFWVGKSILFGMKLADLIGLISFLFVFIWKNRVVSFVCSPVFILSCAYFVLTWIANLILGYAPTDVGLVLFGRVLFLIFLNYFIYLILARASVRQIQNLYFALIIVFVGLASWSIFYVIFYDTLFVGWNLRPSFPFVDEVYRSDAHLLGAYLSISLIFFTENQTKIFNSSSFWVVLSLLVIGCAAIIATGSRVAIFILLFWVLLKSCRHFAFFFKSVFVGVGIFAFGFFLVLGLDLDLGYGFERLFSVGMVGDASINKRFDGLAEVIVDAQSRIFLLGRSLLFANYYYFDGSLTFLIYNFGIVGLLIFFIGFAFCILPAGSTKHR